MSSYDIRIRIVFRDDDLLPIGLITTVASIVERIVFDLERDDLRRAAELDKFTGDDLAKPLALAEQWISSYKGTSLVVREVRAGSIVLESLVAGIVLFILKQTIGETIKDTWLATSAHKNVKQFILENASTRPTQIVEMLRRKLRRRKDVELVDVQQDKVPGADEETLIIVVVRSSRAVPPPRGQLLNERSISRPDDDAIPA